MFERFTEEARQAVVLAQEEARMANNDFIGSGHLLLGALRSSEPAVALLRSRFGVDVDTVRAIVVASIPEPGPTPVSGQIPFEPDAKSALEGALRAALDMRDSVIDADHIVLSLLAQHGTTAVMALERVGVEVAALADALRADRAAPALGRAAYPGGPAKRSAVVVRPNERRRTGNVEFLALSEHTPHFNLSLITMAPHRHGPEMHSHSDEDDSFLVLEGEMTFWVDGEEVTAPAGTFVLVPPGIEHTFENRTDAEARILNIHAPAGFDKRLLGND